MIASYSTGLHSPVLASTMRYLLRDGTCGDAIVPEHNKTSHGGEATTVLINAVSGHTLLFTCYYLIQFTFNTIHPSQISSRTKDLIQRHKQTGSARFIGIVQVRPGCDWGGSIAVVAGPLSYRILTVWVCICPSGALLKTLVSSEYQSYPCAKKSKKGWV